MLTISLMEISPISLARHPGPNHIGQELDAVMSSQILGPSRSNQPVQMNALILLTHFSRSRKNPTRLYYEVLAWQPPLPPPPPKPPFTHPLYLFIPTPFTPLSPYFYFLIPNWSKECAFLPPLPPPNLFPYSCNIPTSSPHPPPPPPHL